MKTENVKIEPEGNGWGVTVSGRTRSTHRNYSHALAALSPSERGLLAAEQSESLRIATRRAEISDRLGPDWDQAITYPETGLDANT